MTGWRLGWIAGPKWVVGAINKLQGQYTSGPCSIAQKAAVAAYKGDQSCVEAMRVAFQRRRDLIVKLAKEVPGFKVNDPKGAFYIFPDCSAYLGKSFNGEKIATAADLAMESSRTGARIVKAKVPLAETFGYVTSLRTISSGRATSSMEFSHYAEVSTAIAKAVVTEAKGKVELL